MGLNIWEPTMYNMMRAFGLFYVDEDYSFLTTLLCVVFFLEKLLIAEIIYSDFSLMCYPPTW